jgi:hypothetical protein
MVQGGGRATGAEGSASVESVVIIPVAMMVVFLVVQLCLWAFAGTLVQAAAAAGEQAATSVSGTAAAGQTEARTELADTASGIVVDPSVQAQVLIGGQIEVTVSGNTETIIPWLRLPVSATRVGVSQEFRESG